MRRVGDAAKLVRTRTHGDGLGSELSLLGSLEVARPLLGMYPGKVENLGAQIVSDACNEALYKSALASAV